MAAVVSLPPQHVNGFSSTLGSSIPALTPHAVSVSLPTWQDNVDYEEGRDRVVKAMDTGYPRFFIHKSIQKLAAICETRFALPGERCLVFPSSNISQSCRSFLSSRSPPVTSRIVEFRPSPSIDLVLSDPSANDRTGTGTEGKNDALLDVTLHLVFFRAEDFPVAKQFWQHTGDGISSRLAAYCLSLLCPSQLSNPSSSSAVPDSSSDPSNRPKATRGYSRNRHYSKTPSSSASPASATTLTSPPTAAVPTAITEEEIDSDAHTYVEERYGRNLSLSLAPLAKIALRRRISGTLQDDPCVECSEEQKLIMSTKDLSLSNDGESEGKNRTTKRGKRGLTEDDVYLYPCGMSAIFHAHQISIIARQKIGKEIGKSICFGFPYTDTLKILQKWGPGCEFFGFGTDEDIDSLEALLSSHPSTSPPFQALFCEFPSNPLLRSPNLRRLRDLADRFGFLIVLDETVGNFVNVEVLEWVDVVVSSLTKIFSGDCNVMGGSLTLNPDSPHHDILKSSLESHYEDTCFPEDSIFMERNSRDFRQRIEKVNHNAEMLCDLLWDRRYSEGTNPRGVIKMVYYPKYVTPENYLACIRKHPSSNPNTNTASSESSSLTSDPKPGYGGLFSLTFKTHKASELFFDNLNCYKGPSLGTNFTLASPYTVLAHYGEREWAESWGVEEGLVRVSVGLEDPVVLRECFEFALRKAEEGCSV